MGVKSIACIQGEVLLPGFYDCLTCEDAKASVLSLTDVEDIYYNITYIPRKAYIMHMNDRDLVFNRQNKLYVADFSGDWINQEVEESYALICMIMVAKKEHMYTKKEVEGVKRSGEFIRNAGYPSKGEAINLVVRDGVQDVRTLYDIYDGTVEAIRGKMTKNKRDAAREEMDPCVKEEHRI